jgi:hypothetical protein
MVPALEAQEELSRIDREVDEIERWADDKWPEDRDDFE